jgi:hypothetical protein
MKNKMDLIGSWVTKAKKDLISVEHELSFEDPVLESICFHSQQTVEKLTIEDDFFTAIDDLNKNDVDAGAGHLCDTEFGHYHKTKLD